MTTDQRPLSGLSPGYVEGLNDAGTKLAAFFSILLKEAVMEIAIIVQVKS